MQYNIQFDTIYVQCNTYCYCNYLCYCYHVFQLPVCLIVIGALYSIEVVAAVVGVVVEVVVYLLTIRCYMKTTFTSTTKNRNFKLQTWTWNKYVAKNVNREKEHDRNAHPYYR